MMRYWMVRIIKYFVLAFILLTIESKAGQTNIIEYKPVWSVGQKWRVEVEKMTEPPSVPKKRLEKWKPTKSMIIYQFEMEGVVEVDGEKCSQLKIEAVANNGTEITYRNSEDKLFHRVFLRQADNTLKMVERVRGQSGHIENSRNFSDGAIDLTDYVGSIPLAFAAFSTDEQTREIPTRMNKKGEIVFKDSDRCRQSEQMELQRVNGKDEDTLKIVIEKDQHGGPGGPSLRTTQTWVKGMPWWSKAKYERDGKEWCSAKLIKD